MIIGCDVDGVLADFDSGYQRFLAWKSRTPSDTIDPLTYITTSRAFWYSLFPYEDSRADLALVLAELEHRHTLYFITARPGTSAKRQTEAWLMRWLPYETTSFGTYHPTVIIASDKAAAAHALHLDVYVDDRLDDAVRVAPFARSYLLDRPYNAGETAAAGVVRITSLAEMFTRELVMNNG